MRGCLKFLTQYEDEVCVNDSPCEKMKDVNIMDWVKQLFTEWNPVYDNLSKKLK